ncbi:MAG TPA: NYN domain-containing protein [Sediminibacterium sp.]
MDTPKQKVIVYVDGFNFYYGLKSRKWKKFYWLDVVSFFESFIKPHQELVEVTYFSATPHDTGKHDRQDLFFSANKLNPKFKLELGRYLPKDQKCIKCGNVHKTFEEKETDVKIATKMISDVVYGRCDISIIVSADSDLTPPIHFIREFSKSHKIFVYFPPNRYSSNLNALANNIKKLDGSTVAFGANLLPESITLPSGYVISRPPSWK